MTLSDAGFAQLRALQAEAAFYLNLWNGTRRIYESLRKH